jgi:hypothetical protein
MWIAVNDLPATGGHPFYQRLNQALDSHVVAMAPELAGFLCGGFNRHPSQRTNETIVATKGKEEATWGPSRSTRSRREAHG